MVLAIAIPLLLTQEYLERSLFKLNEVREAKEIERFPREKYFKVRSIHVEPEIRFGHAAFTTSGRGNNTLKLSIYYAVSFEETSKVWYGVEYKRSRSNNLDEEGRRTFYQNFLDETEAKIQNYNFKNVGYFEKVGPSEARDAYMEAIIERGGFAHPPKDLIVLTPQIGQYKNRLGNRFFWLFGSFGIGALAVLMIIGLPGLDKESYKGYLQEQPIEDDFYGTMVSYLNLWKNFSVPALLIWALLMVFVYCLFTGMSPMSPTAQKLLDLGGVRRQEVLDGEYWRLLTALFLHSGLMHLAMNIGGLALALIFLDKKLKSLVFGVVFIVAGLGASLSSIWWHTNSVSVGASGAIFGLFGVIFAFKLLELYSEEEWGGTWWFLFLYVGGSILFGFSSGIDNAAHIGGLIVGFLLGVLIGELGKHTLLKPESTIEKFP